MFNIKNVRITNLMISVVICLMMFSIPLSATQTIGELEDEIEQIKQDTAKNQEKQKSIETEKVSTKTDISDVKAQMDEINSKIEAKQAEIQKKEAEIEAQNEKIKEIQKKIPSVKKEADKSLLLLQKVSNDNTMVEMVLAPSNTEGDNVLRRMESFNTLAEFAGGTILDLIEVEKELKLEKTVLEKDEAELESVKTDLVTEQRELTAKEGQLEEVLESQTDASTDIQAGIKQSSEDKAMLEDTLAYYKSYGCSEDDIVGSNCGGLGDNDSDGIINDEDKCPDEAGTLANGCPKPKKVETKDDTSNDKNSNDNDSNDDDSSGSSSGGSSSGGSSSGGSSSGSGNAKSFARPLAHGVVTMEFAGYSGHTGTDLDHADKDPVLSTAKGTVITARGGCAPWGGYIGNYCNGGYGNYVMIMHKTSNGTVFSLYGHLSAITVSSGQNVVQGQQIGNLGHSGNSSGSHLHFEVYADSNGNGLPDDYKTNARNYVSFPAKGKWW